MAQKAKVRWSIEGDENSKFFYGIINMKQSQLAIRGVLIEGDWIDKPYRVKNEFLNHFSNRFARPTGPNIVLDSNMFKQLSSEQIADLECDVTYDEIKRAVWDCGTNKSPGPDGFTFDFIRTYWKIINQDVVNAVREFFVTSKFPPGSNSSFIALIPKKQDAKLVKDFRPISLIGCFYKIIAKILANRLSMVISDLISDVQSAFVPNLNFEKAFDSLRWDYLDGILSNFGFGSKRREWIQGCLSSAMGSILVNGSPTSKFKFHKGLKQGDPLSPFLFILVMDSLHLSFNNIMNAGLFKGIHIDDSLTLSHLFYVDDAIFIVKAAASIIGCSTFSNPFTYLGVKVGMSSSRRKSWDEVIGKIFARLSKWKIKTLSIGGRLMLIKSVLTSLPLYHMPIYKAPMGVLRDMESFRRRFFNGIDKNERKISMIGSVLRSSPWICIIRELSSLSSQGINVLAHLKKKVGNGVHTSFWEDSWIKDIPLSQSYPCLYALENRKHITVAEKISEDTLIASYRRTPRGGVEEDQFFQLIELVDSVSSARTYIDDLLLPTVGSPTRWAKVVLIKINIFAWKVCLDKLPMRLNLSLCGIDIPSIVCPNCSLAGESCSHLFFSCSMARLLWRKFARWWDFDIPEFSSYSYEKWITWFKSIRIPKAVKDVLEGVFYVMWWVQPFLEILGLVTDVEANLEQYKIDQAAINSEAAAQRALLQETIEKNKSLIYQQPQHPTQTPAYTSFSGLYFDSQGFPLPMGSIGFGPFSTGEQGSNYNCGPPMSKEGAFPSFGELSLGNSEGIFISEHAIDATP
ncbi:RNA-directed DNA polymerase, eukaryota [Tanacetum coccineum]